MSAFDIEQIQGTLSVLAHQANQTLTLHDLFTTVFRNPTVVDALPPDLKPATLYRVGNTFYYNSGDAAFKAPIQIHLDLNETTSRIQKISYNHPITGEDGSPTRHVVVQSSADFIHNMYYLTRDLQEGGARDLLAEHVDTWFNNHALPEEPHLVQGFKTLRAFQKLKGQIKCYQDSVSQTNRSIASARSQGEDENSIRSIRESLQHGTLKNEKSIQATLGEFQDVILPGDALPPYHIFSLDVDACLVVAGEIPGAREKQPLPTDLYTLNHYLFAEYIPSILKENGGQGAIWIGSSRQDLIRDSDQRYGRTGDHSGYSCFPIVQSLTEQTRVTQTGIDLQFDPTLLPDVIHDLPAGQTMSAARGELVQREGYYPLYGQLKTQFKSHYAAFADESKISLLYMQAHIAARRQPNRPIELRFFDDRRDILEALQLFFNAHPEFLPRNVRLYLYEYHGSSPKADKEAALPSTDKPALYQTTIQGRGDLDLDLSESLLELARLGYLHHHDAEKKQDQTREYWKNQLCTQNPETLSSIHPLHRFQNEPQALQPYIHTVANEFSDYHRREYLAKRRRILKVVAGVTSVALFIAGVVGLSLITGGAADVGAAVFTFLSSPYPAIAGAALIGAATTASIALAALTVKHRETIKEIFKKRTAGKEPEAMPTLASTAYDEPYNAHVCYEGDRRSTDDDDEVILTGEDLTDSPSSPNSRAPSPTRLSPQANLARSATALTPGSQATLRRDESLSLKELSAESTA